jgi:hypothetical protein
MRLDAVVLFERITMPITWEDGKLSGDELAVGMLSVDPWLQPIGSGDYPNATDNPYAFVMACKDTFDTLVSLEGPLEPLVGDYLTA